MITHSTGRPPRQKQETGFPSTVTDVGHYATITRLQEKVHAHDRCCRNFNHARFIRNDVMACPSKHASARSARRLVTGRLVVGLFATKVIRAEEAQTNGDRGLDIPRDATGQVVSDDGN